MGLPQARYWDLVASRYRNPHSPLLKCKTLVAAGLYLLVLVGGPTEPLAGEGSERLVAMDLIG